MAFIDVLWLGLLSGFMAFFLPLVFLLVEGGLTEADELST